ncbi:hypothetical protein AKO1_009147 [Acrasis kona]|uniref:Inhibitor I9 domain-containing protein n=1 Tax=Acrasis kona TaxID=1008807 RepID=A0AAW2ZJ40_9EUKA
MHPVIVSFRDDATPDQIETAKQLAAQNGKIGHEYTIIKGFSATLTEENYVKELESLPGVQAVEADGVVTTC